MASTAWKRKSYGPVKPVKQPKAPQPRKPSVLELKAIYRTIATATNDLHIDAMGQALYWFEHALPYIKMKRPVETLTQTRLLVSAFEFTVKGQKSESKKEKEVMFMQALNAFSKYANTVFSTPQIWRYLKEMRKHNLAHKGVNKTLNTRFDKLLSLLTQCFASADFEFKVTQNVFSILTRKEILLKLDHVLSTMFISRAHAVALQKNIRSQGLLPTMIHFAFVVSRAMAYDGVSQGAFIVNHRKHLEAYHQLMQDIAHFAANNPSAPKQLVKRNFGKKAKKAKPAPEPDDATEHPADNYDNDGEG